MPCYKGGFVLDFILTLLAAVHASVRTRSDTALEVLGLRQRRSRYVGENGPAPT